MFPFLAFPGICLGELGLFMIDVSDVKVRFFLVSVFGLYVGIGVGSSCGRSAPFSWCSCLECGLDKCLGALGLFVTCESSAQARFLIVSGFNLRCGV